MRVHSVIRRRSLNANCMLTLRIWWRGGGGRDPHNDNRAAGIVLGVLPYMGTGWTRSLMGIGTWKGGLWFHWKHLETMANCTGSGRLAVVDSSSSPCSGPCFARGMARFHGPEGRQLMRNVQGTHGKWGLHAWLSLQWFMPGEKGGVLNSIKCLRIA